MSPGFGALGFQSRKVHFSQFSYSRNLPLSGAVHTALGACNASGDAGKLAFTGLVTACLGAGAGWQGAAPCALP